MMTHEQVQNALIRLRFEGKWPIRQLAKEIGLSPDTISRAMDGCMTPSTQARVAMALRVITAEFPAAAPKGKPGHKKRYLYRYLNLRKWVATLESVAGKNPAFMFKRRYDLSTSDKAGFVCTKFDYCMKWYLLKVFGQELAKKKVYFGDCYPAEQWVLRIQKMLPNYRRELVANLIKRR